MKIPILLITHDRPYLLEKVLSRVLKFTDWSRFDLWILDNDSPHSTRQLIEAFKNKFNFINIFSSDINQIAHIQNQLISELKSEMYIKLDDDILVTENWTDGFIGVYERNYEKMSIGSVIIPVNGFGWLPFLKIMNLEVDFSTHFPDEKLVQDCMEVPVWRNEKVVEYIWNKSLDIDKTAQSFIKNQDNHFRDLICPHRYSIGAIIFSHSTWEKMGGWKVSNAFLRRMNLKRKSELLTNLADGILKKEKLTRINQLFKIMLKLDKSELGAEEQAVYEYTKQNNLIIPVTTESIVFHYSFGNTEDYINQKLLLEIK